MKKKRKLNLGKRSIATINSLHMIKGGTMISDVCPSETIYTCLTNEGASTCPTIPTVPVSATCPGGTMNESGTDTQTCNCSANLPSLNC
ncbi:hypothetical protein [Kordia jejudonensis]|uniref:hypothetical protein n=1 Tax=Kordia jejudonensis TaxID=1348245 RepID=UPI00138E4B45|nr:hypothetical protein [Kordia jejudonensis]